MSLLCCGLGIMVTSFIVDLLTRETVHKIQIHVHNNVNGTNGGLSQAQLHMQNWYINQRLIFGAF